MKLHTAHTDPDWELVGAAKRNMWQRLAFATRGVATPANVLSLAGLLLVCWGAWRLYGDSRMLGLGLIVAGRLADVADGYVAEATGTKSRLGETVDVVCDKLAVGITLLAVFAAQLVPWWFLVLLTGCNLYLALFGLTTGRKYRLHPNRSAKLAMFTSWAALCCLIIVTGSSTAVVGTVSLSWAALYAWLFAGALRTYWHEVHAVKH